MKVTVQIRGTGPDRDAVRIEQDLVYKTGDQIMVCHSWGVMSCLDYVWFVLPRPHLFIFGPV